MCMSASVCEGVNNTGVCIQPHVRKFYREIAVPSLDKLNIQFGEQVVGMLADDTGINQLSLIVLRISLHSETQISFRVNPSAPDKKG